MLKIAAAAMVAAIAFAGAAGAQTLLLPQPEMLLVKHDDDDGPGRKLGHYKHWNKHAEKEWKRSQKEWQRYGTREYVPVPVPYYVPVPSYGSSYPPPAYGYYGY